MDSSLNRKEMTREITDALICIPIWGKNYIDKFLNLTIHSYFSTNNIPAVSSIMNTHVVFLTDPQGRRAIENSLIFKRYFGQTPASFIDIQDLITDSQYTFTLTMAYARAINSIASPKVGHTLAIILNADFFLSDKSLLNVAKKAMSGYQAIYGASLRCKDIDTSRTLKRELRKPGFSGDFDSRKLVELTLQNLHPTVTAMTLNNGFCYYTQVRQFFFRVNDSCLLAHKYLLCIIGLVPQKHIKEVNSYHDYSFVPELTSPDARYVFKDSDEYFAMELQDTGSEGSYIRLGQPKNTQLAKSAGNWIMDEHRWASQYQVIFHAGDIPPDLEVHSKTFRKHFEEIDKLLKKSTRDHVNHFHWTSGVLVWKSKRQEMLGHPISLEEIDPKIRRISIRERVYAYIKYPISTWRFAKKQFRKLIVKKLKAIYGKLFLSEEKTLYQILQMDGASTHIYSSYQEFRLDILNYEPGSHEGKLVLLMNPDDLAHMQLELKNRVLELTDYISLDFLVVRNSMNIKGQDSLLIEFLGYIASLKKYKIYSWVHGSTTALLSRQAIKFVFRVGRQAQLLPRAILITPAIFLFLLLLALNVILRSVPKKRRRQTRIGSFVHVRLRREP